MDEQPTSVYQREPLALGASDPAASTSNPPDPSPAPSHNAETTSLRVVSLDPVTLPPMASLGDRMLGLFVDCLVGVGLFFFFGLLVSPRFGGASATGFELDGLPAGFLLGSVSLLGLAYFVLFESVGGATLGKVVAGTRVRSTDGRRLGFRAAVVRNVMRIIDGIGLYLVGALSVLVTRRRQRLGDLAARTVVIQRSWPPALRVIALLVALMSAAAGIAGGYALRGAPLTDAVAFRPSAIGGGGPRFSSLTLTDDRNVSVDKRVFPTTTPTFYLLFTLTDVPENSAVRAVWVAEQVAGGQSDLRIDEAQVVAGGARANQGEFSLARSGTAWPPGNYRVELLIAGRPIESVRFRIENGPGGASLVTGSPIPVGTPTR